MAAVKTGVASWSRTEGLRKSPGLSEALGYEAEKAIWIDSTSAFKVHH